MPRPLLLRVSLLLLKAEPLPACQTRRTSDLGPPHC